MNCKVALPEPTDKCPSVISLFASLDSLKSVSFNPVQLRFEGSMIYVFPADEEGLPCTLKTEKNQITWMIPKCVSNLSGSIDLLKRELIQWVIEDQRAKLSYQFSKECLVFTRVKKLKTINSLPGKKEMDKKLLLIDGSNLLSISYYGTAIQGEDHLLMSPGGLYTNGVYAMTRKILNMINDYGASHIAICWDVDRETTFRKYIYPDYKGLRDETPGPLKQQYSTAQLLFREMNIPQFSVRGYEADDVIGTIQKKWTMEGHPCYIVSNDKDIYQLLNDKTTIIRMTKNGVQRVKENDFTNLYNITPRQWIDVKALLGESGKSSDNIPGVKGIGDKAAVPMVINFGSLEMIYESLSLIKADRQFKRYARLLENGKEMAFLSKRLSTIVTDIRELMSLNLEDLSIQINKEKMIRSFEHLGFKSILHDLYRGKFKVS